MCQKYKIKDLLKNLPFWTSKIKKFKKKKKNFADNRFLSELPFLPKKVKNLTNYQLSRELPFFPKRLKNILPFYDTVRISISRGERAYKRYIEPYNVKVVDRISSSDSLFLAKSSIVDLFKDLLKEKRGFKYNLMTTITLKVWNNTTNTYDIKTVYFDPGP